MAKIKGKLIKNKGVGPLAYLKRTLKKSGGDDFEESVKSIRLKSKRRKKND